MAANTIITSIVTGGTNSHTTTAEEANSIRTDFGTAGIIGAITLNTGSGGTGGFCVNADASPDMGVTVKAGTAQFAVTPSSQDSQMLRATAAADYTTYTISSNASGSTKYDWIYLSGDATKANNPAADASDVTSIVTSRSSSNTTDNGSPPTYGLLLAVVTVANGASSITNSNITDKRYNASLGAQNGSLIVQQNGTGTDAIVQAAGIDASVNIDVNAKGSTGNVNLKPGASGNVQENGSNIDWWTELGRTTLGSSGATITVSGFTAKKYLLIQVSILASSAVSPVMTFNNDTGSNYADRWSNNGGADSTDTSASYLTIMVGSVGVPQYQVLYVVNNSANEKLVQGGMSVSQGTAGAGNAPGRFEFAGKWSNTSAQITRVDVKTGSNSFLTGSEVVVLGHN